MEKIDLQVIKTLKTNFSQVFSLLLFFIAFPLFQLMAQGSDSNSQVLNAHELLKNGQIEEGIKLLESVLDNDAQNAMAYFELSRTEPEEKLSYLEKAVEMDSQNPMYAFELANAYMLEAYKAMQKGDEEAVNKPLEQCISSLKHVLDIKSDCKESLMFLLELNVMFDDIGTKDDASKYLAKLKEIDAVYGAQGELILASSDIDAFDFWQSFMDNHGRTPELLIRQGMASLNGGKTEKAETIFKEVLNKDPDRNDLYLQLARGHLYKAMRAKPDARQKEVDLIKKYIGIYLEKENNKAKNVEAWCYGWLSSLERRSGNEELAQTYLGKAKNLDPNFSRATALPSDKFDFPPNEISYHYKSYFTPF